MTVYRVEYLVRAGNDGSIVATREVQVTAANKASAGAAAVERAHAEDPYVDDRIDPRVEILSVTRVEDLS